MDDDEKMIQQMMEMLAKMDADRKADKEELMANRKADKEELMTKMEADRRAEKEERKKANQEFLARMDAIFDDNRKKAEEDREADKEDAIDEKRMAMLDDHQNRMMATKKSEQDTEMMQSAEEHRDIPTKNVAVMPVAEPRKRRRGKK
jgi:membrane protein involved in colicin uptake